MFAPPICGEMAEQRPSVSSDEDGGYAANIAASEAAVRDARTAHKNEVRLARART